MEWNAQSYFQTCGRVTEHGLKLVDSLKGIPCNTVLDLGCGTGKLTSKIAEFANKVIGIDASPAMVAKAKATYPSIEFAVMDACSLQWENYFDVVFSNAVFHFIQTQDILLDNIHKVLLKNGLLICEFGASGNISGLLDAISYACITRKKPYSLRFFYPSEEEYRCLLESYGFTVEYMISYGLDTKLIEGESGLRNWINQIFCVEMDWFDDFEREEVLKEIENTLRSEQWDGSNWHLANRRIQVAARKV